VPPRHGKSELTSHWFPVWYLNLWPERNIIFTSYEARYAASWGRKVRDSIIEHKQDLRVSIRGDTAAADEWQTTKGGGMITAGARGPITGRGGHIIIIDDPFKSREEAESSLIRQRVDEWYKGTVRTRIEPTEESPEGVIVIITTRWHEDDIVGRLTKPEEMMEETGIGWHVFSLPALAEKNDPLNREENAPLWPQKFSQEFLLKTKADIGPYDWESQYQQHPTRKEGSVFKEEWFTGVDIAW
jgi:hypothetical protein